MDICVRTSAVAAHAVTPLTRKSLTQGPTPEVPLNLANSRDLVKISFLRVIAGVTIPPGYYILVFNTAYPTDNKMFLLCEGKERATT